MFDYHRQSKQDDQHQGRVQEIMQPDPSGVIEVQITEDVPENSFVFPTQDVSKIIDAAERKEVQRQVGGNRTQCQCPAWAVLAHGINLPAAMVISQCEGVFI